MKNNHNKDVIWSYFLLAVQRSLMPQYALKKKKKVLDQLWCVGDKESVIVRTEEMEFSW